jgi:threonylcarbamoyladenosine tRNA methylthiotransferase MtaB
VTTEVITFGCRLNAAESDAVRLLAGMAGCPDTVVLNTCAVTGEAVRKARQTLRRLRRERPHARLVVTGCAAQAEPETFARMPEADVVAGNDRKLDQAFWRGLAEAGPSVPRVQVNPLSALRQTGPHLSGTVEGRVRAFLQVQDGCDHRCTFCVIPFGRGNARSAPPDKVVERVRQLVSAGAPEVVLTGVDLTSYGQDLPGHPRLGALVRTVLREVPELRRLRLSSIDPAEVDPGLLAAIAEEERLMPHLHLSLQAGDDLILKRMKRRHSRAAAVALCGTLRRLRPDIVLGADLIAGFPTEDEAMFANSLTLPEDCGLAHLHVFPFSAREGTPAARMPAVAAGRIAERAARLREEGRRRLGHHLAARVGLRGEVLAERGGIGRLPDFTAVRLPDDAVPGRFMSVTIDGHDGRTLTATGS